MGGDLVGSALPLPTSGRDRPRAFLLGLLVLVAAASFLPPHLAILLRNARGGSSQAVRGVGSGARAGGAWSERVEGGGPDLPGPSFFFSTRDEGGSGALRGGAGADLEGVTQLDISKICPNREGASDPGAGDAPSSPVPGSGQGIVQSARGHVADVGLPKQRILLYTGSYNHIRDGVALTLNRMVRFLLDEGHSVLVLAPSTSEPAIDHEGDLLEVPSFAAPGRKEYRVSYKLTKNIKKKMKEFKPSVVHVATPDYIGGQTQAWAIKQGIPVGCSYHTRFNSYLAYYRLGVVEGLLWEWMEKFYGRCEQTYIPSYGIRDELRDHGIRSELLMWSRGVNSELFTPKKRCDSWRRAVGAEGDTPVVLMVCRLVWEKGLAKFIAAVQGLEKAGLKHRSVVVGDGPARKEMQTQLPSTTFLGTLKGHDLATAYASSDVYVFPSHTETFGVTTLEAMASGLPVVVANASGPAMLVKHGENGFMADPNRSEQFLTYTQQLVEDGALRRQMGEVGRNISVTQFHWNEVFSSLVHYYANLTHGIDSGDDVLHINGVSQSSAH